MSTVLEFSFFRQFSEKVITVIARDGFCILSALLLLSLAAMLLAINKAATLGCENLAGRSKSAIMGLLFGKALIDPWTPNQRVSQLRRFHDDILAM